MSDEAKGASAWALVVVSVIVLARCTPSTDTYFGPWVVQGQTTIRNGLTQRERTLVTFQQAGRRRYTMLWPDDTLRRDIEVELPKGTHVPVGTEMTREEIDELKGQSNLGRAWDFLLKPRRTK